MAGKDPKDNDIKFMGIIEDVFAAEKDMTKTAKEIEWIVGKVSEQCKDLAAIDELEGSLADELKERLEEAVGVGELVKSDCVDVVMHWSTVMLIFNGALESKSIQRSDLENMIAVLQKGADKCKEFGVNFDKFKCILLEAIKAASRVQDDLRSQAERLNREAKKAEEDGTNNAIAGGIAVAAIAGLSIFTLGAGAVIAGVIGVGAGAAAGATTYYSAQQEAQKLFKMVDRLKSRATDLGNIIDSLNKIESSVKGQVHLTDDMIKRLQKAMDVVQYMRSEREEKEEMQAKLQSEKEEKEVMQAELKQQREAIEQLKQQAEKKKKGKSKINCKVQ